jgi:myo-inositol-1(or 4)-monophosphatase
MPHADGPVEPAGRDEHDGALVQLACRLATAAGTAAAAGRAATVAEGLATGTKSSATDLVTVHDRAAEQLVVDALREERPDDAVVGEEGAAVAGGSGYAWFVDPIDGTTNFVYGLASWCTSVAVTHDGDPVAGAVYVPATGELFAARRGGGATLDGVPIRCTDRADLRLALVATGFAYDADRRRAQAATLARLIGEIRDVRRLGSAAIDLCHVACGRVDAYYEQHLNAWDVAAGALIAREAGAVVSDYAGGAPDPSNLLAAAPGIHGALRALLQP